MKKLLLPLLFGCLLAAHISIATDLADVSDHRTCAYCGMDRGKFPHSRTLSEGNTIAPALLRPLD